MEISIECVYAIPEATATGLLLIGGQVLCILMVNVYPKIAPDVPENSFTYTNVQTCINPNSTFTGTLNVVEYNTPIYGQTALYLLLSFSFIVFFKCPYSRLRTEK